MTGDMGCLVWQRAYFPKTIDYGFPYASTGIEYFAGKTVRAEESQHIRTWYREKAITDLDKAIDEPRDEDDRAALICVRDVLVGEDGTGGQYEMFEEFENHVHSIETEEMCLFGMDYTTMFKVRFELVKSVSQLILDAVADDVRR